jgi:DNA-binding Lrp family transcriptional regulator
MSGPLSKVDGFIPVIEVLTEEMGLIASAVYGLVWRYCQGDKGLCYASLAKMGKQLGVNPATVQRHLKTLCEQGYIKDLTPDLRNKPHTYRDMGKAKIEMLVAARVEDREAADVAECNAEQPEPEPVLQSAKPHCTEQRHVAESTLSRVVVDDLVEQEQAGAKAPAGASHKAREGPTNQDKEKRGSLADVFVEHTNIKQLPARNKTDYRRDQRLWWSPLQKILDLCDGDLDMASRLVENTVKQMRRDSLTIANPNSILNPATALHATAPQTYQKRKRTRRVRVVDPDTGQVREIEAIA